MPESFHQHLYLCHQHLAAGPLSRLYGSLKKRQRELDLRPAHGARVLPFLYHPVPQARVAAPVHARVDAEPSDRAVRKIVRVQIDRADCLPPRRQVAALDQHTHNAKQCATNHVHLAEGLCRDATVPARQCAEVRA